MHTIEVLHLNDVLLLSVIQIITIICLFPTFLIRVYIHVQGEYRFAIVLCVIICIRLWRET